MKHSPSSSGDFALSVVCRTPGLMTCSGLCWLEAELWLWRPVAASHRPFVYSTPQRTLIFVLLFFNSLHGLFGSSSSALGWWEFCWCEDPVWAAVRSSLRPVCLPRLGARSLHFQSLAPIEHQTATSSKKSEWKLEFGFESEVFPASQGFYFEEARRRSGERTMLTTHLFLNCESLKANLLFISFNFSELIKSILYWTFCCCFFWQQNKTCRKEEELLRRASCENWAPAA